MKQQLYQVRQEIIDHPFRQILHKQFAYKLAFDSFKKKIFNFREEMVNFGINDQMIFDDFVANTFAIYQFYSDKKNPLVLLKKSRIKKIEKLARNLQAELNKGLIFDDHKLQEQIYSTLNHLLEIKKPPAIVPYRRHTKVAREMIIKGLALNLYELHYERMYRYESRLPYEKMETKKLTLSTAFVDTITHIVSIIDSDITERRVASLVARIKPQIKSKYPGLFSPKYDANMQEMMRLLS